MMLNYIGIDVDKMTVSDFLLNRVGNEFPGFENGAQNPAEGSAGIPRTCKR